MMESINVDTGPATAVPGVRWSPYRPHSAFSEDENNVPPPLLVDGVTLWVPFLSVSGSGGDANDFMTVENNLGAGLSGIKLNKLGVYWVSGGVRPQITFTQFNRYLEVFAVGPSFEDRASMSTNVPPGGGAGTLNTNFGVGRVTHIAFTGFAVVTDLSADNHVYVGVLYRGSPSGSLPAFLDMNITYMGLADVGLLNG